MKEAAWNSRTEHAVALLSLFVGILGLAFTLQQTGASLGVVLVVVGLGFVIPVAMGNFSLPRFFRRDPNPVLVADACRQVANSIDALWTERRNWPTRPGGQVGISRQEWDLETKKLYDDGLRPWAIEVFDDAVACGALATSSRPLVRNPPPAQLYKLGDLFRGAADTLERNDALQVYQ